MVSEVDVRSLHTMRPGMPWSLVTMPGVVGPCTTTQYLTWTTATNDSVKQGTHVGETVDTVFTNNTQEAHTTAILHNA